jgi:hypothetical protein
MAYPRQIKVSLPRIAALEHHPAWDQDAQPVRPNGHALRFVFEPSDGLPQLRIVVPEVFYWNALWRLPIRVAKPDEDASQVFYPGDRVTLTEGAPLLVFIRAHPQWFRRISQ